MLEKIANIDQSSICSAKLLKKKSKPNIFQFSSSKNIAFRYTISLSNLFLMKIYVNCNYIPLHQLLNSVDTRAGNSNLQNVWGTNKAQRYIVP